MKLLKRSDLCRAVAEKNSLPLVGSTPVPMMALSPRVKHFLEDPEKLMLCPDGPQRMKVSEVTPFTDPALKSRRAALRLACQLWMSGLLRGAKQIKGHIHPFTVFKKLLVEPARSVKDIVMRMVLDQRVDNLQCKEPPWTPMSNPSMFPYVETSAGTMGDSDQVEMMTWDLPDWYWTPEPPTGLEEYFIMENVSPNAVEHALITDHGVAVSFSDDIVAVGMRVLVMGWAWAVTLAHWVLEDLLEKAVSEFKSSARLHYKVVLPQFSANQKVQHWELIDDVGALVLGRKGDAETSTARDLGAKTKTALKLEGFGYHKDTYGLEAVSLGHEISPETFGVRVTRQKFWHGIGALEHLLAVKTTTAETLEALTSFWCCWASLVTRCALSIWRRVYGYIEMSKGKGELKIPNDALEEFQAFLFLAPLYEAKMDISWVPEVFMVDSCFEGAGVVETTASLEEIWNKAQFAETKGWSVFLAEVDTTVESREEVDSSESFDPIPTQVEHKKIRAHNTFSGPRRNQDFEYYMEVVASTMGIYMIVESIDPIMNASFNLLDDAFFRCLIQAITATVFMIHLPGAPCSTWSIARFRRPGPPVVRTRDHPCGNPGLSTKHRALVGRHSQLMRRAFQLARAIAQAGSLFAIENPKDPGQAPYPSMFATDIAEQLRAESKAIDVIFTQCMTGQEYLRPTQILTNARGITVRLQGLLCTHGRKAHPNMGGVSESGQYVTKGQARYSPMLSKTLAEGFSDDFGRPAQLQIAEAKEEEEPETLWVKSRAPTIAKNWESLDRWHETFRTTWARREHNNIGELRVSVLTLKHVARSRRRWDKRVLIMTDSLDGLGVLTKGRSSSWPLLRLARQAAALQLGMGLRPYMRYIETDRSQADGPSRGFGIGHAPDWSHKREAQQKKVFTQQRRTRAGPHLKKRVL